MTRERSATLTMPAGEPHCEPTTECVVRGRCLRHIAKPSGAAPRDYTADAGGGTAACAGFWLLAHALAPRRPARAA